MHDPFKITSPTCISFSGGRTSGYMLWRVLQSNGGLPDDALVLFDNTGKEEEATLKFINDCATNWNVPIVWLEFRDNEKKFAVVDYKTASRNGEPFEALIRKRGFLPNPVARFCTVELKVRTSHRYLQSLGWTEWDSLVGIRADEQRRFAKMKNQDYGSKEDRFYPLGIAGLTIADVQAFWDAQPFNLELATYNGRTLAGNCDLCFLKAGNQVQTLISEKPERADWWAKMEALALASKPSGAVFRSDRPSYATMKANAANQVDAFGFDETIPCFCGD